jgi:CMP-N,N'-diacetyllegionaminic acid synthase
MLESSGARVNASPMTALNLRTGDSMRGSNSVLGVIPARGGSKGIPDKNIRELHGKPLIAYAIEAALESRNLGRVVVSTDSPRIAEIARDLGAEVPFLRPSSLAADDTPMLPVLGHAIETLNSIGDQLDTVVCLQPTSPLRKTRHIDEAIDLFRTRSCPALVSVCPVRESPHWMLEVDDGIGRPFLEGGWEGHSRQLLPALFRLNGAIYVFSLDTVVTRRTLPDEVCVYEMDAISSIDIDSEIDWALASALMGGAR